MNQLIKMLKIVGMKSVTILFIGMTMSFLLSAQSDLVTSIAQGENSSSELCADITVTNTTDEEAKILGQNVRIFYNSEKLSFNNITLTEGTSESAFSLEVVTDKRNLRKNGKGQLAFENQLGFVNYNVTLENDYLFEGIVNPAEDLKVQKVCFTKLSADVNISDIVLAQDGITDKYSRAYTQIESIPTLDDLLLPATLTDMEYQEEIASLHE